MLMVIEKQTLRPIYRLSSNFEPEFPFGFHTANKILSIDPDDTENLLSAIFTLSKDILLGKADSEALPRLRMFTAAIKRGEFPPPPNLLFITGEQK